VDADKDDTRHDEAKPNNGRDTGERTAAQEGGGCVASPLIEKFSEVTLTNCKLSEMMDVKLMTTGKHTDEPAATCTKPGPQVKQADRPESGANDPKGHTLQAHIPAVAEKVPTGQIEHMDWPIPA